MDNGREFEQRALALARAIFDPAGLQGSLMVDGRERDAIFVTDQNVTILEFTQLRTKDKAEKDGRKLADLLVRLENDPAHRFKGKVGYFVTQSEPTAEQRSMIDRIASDRRVPLKCLSIASLRGMLVNAEEYIARRLDAPFGSTSFRLDGRTLSGTPEDYVDPVIRVGQTRTTVDQLAEDVLNGSRTVVTGDFGAGKSELLHQVFLRLRRRYFKNPLEGRLPIHVNLRECAGLRSPSELLRRHSEEVGLSGAAGLLPAWRANSTTLLLDGFDEVIPTRWIGSVRDLRQVRWHALEAVRQLVEQSPDDTGVLIAGRAQYFAEDDEILETLGISTSETVAELLDFDPESAARLLGTDSALPDWLPSRPLLLRYLAMTDVLGRLASSADDFDEAAAWVEMIDLLAKREADRIASVDPTRVRELLGRIATSTRGSDSAGQIGSGAISMTDMQQAFREVCGYLPEEEGQQLLLRLPGLTRAEHAEGQEMRTFVDAVFADAAYGTDLAAYIAAPYSEHPLTRTANWTAGTNDLGSRVAANILAKQEFPAGHVKSAINARLDMSQLDAVLVDLIAVADYNDIEAAAGDSIHFREMLIATLAPGSPNSYLSISTLQDCLIEVLDVEDVDSVDQLPRFGNCIIGSFIGRTSIPAEWAEKFHDCDIQRFSQAAETTAGLMAVDRPEIDRIALTILKKVYAQAGSGRKLSALSRGLPLEARGSVPGIVAMLVANGYVAETSRRAETLILPVKKRGTEVRRWIAEPATFPADLVH